MKKYKLRSSLFICLTSLVVGTHAAKAQETYPYTWNGFYLGALAGADFSRFNTKTSTQAGPLLDAAQANAVNQAGNQTMYPKGFLSGFEGGYNWQVNHWLLGLETDIQALSINDSTYSNAITTPTRPDRQFVITSYGSNNWLFTARPRLGFVANNWMFYVTGGLGLAYLQSDFLFTNNVGGFESQRVNQVKPGYIVGGGVETALTNRIKLKAEYLFADFNNTSAFQMNHNVPADQTFKNSVNLKSNLIRLGVVYQFDPVIKAATTSRLALPGLLNPCLWDTEMGTRVFVSTSIDGAPNPLLSQGMLVSRLTFTDLTAVSGETFARADHVTGLFLKGYLGAGTVTHGGYLNDEDFPAGGAYSNTLSNASGNLAYATADVGYSFFKTPSGKFGAFVGYNYYDENVNIYNCKQVAGALVCSPGYDLHNLLALSQTDTYNSLRLGLSSQFDLTNRLSLISEAAYLPVIGMNGTDYHNARQLILPERSANGNGAMLEAILDYQLSRSWNVGFGGRYWMWNMKKGSVSFDFLGDPGNINESARFNAERYGMFLQLSYHDRKSCKPDLSRGPLNWKGIFVGGHLGGAWGKSNWSDPFGSTPATLGLINMAGFGDRIRSTGPLGGLDLNLNWQSGQLVYGIGGSFSAANIYGENTLFSGLGGVNGRNNTNYLVTLVGKAGLAFNRSLLYMNAGSAVLNTQYTVNGNTTVLSLGSQKHTLNAWGWTGGIGAEYALTDHWTTNVEYDYIHIPNRSLKFSSIETINGNKVSVNQNMNLMKLGLNYKFDVCARG